MHNQSIEKAKDYKTSIEIISQDLCEKALVKMRVKFKEQFPDPKSVSVIPILVSGRMIGNNLAKYFKFKTNPMRMSYYNEDTSRREKPICIIKPDIKKIVLNKKTLPVLFTETVVETQGTLLSAMEEINRMIDQYSKEINVFLEYPKYYTFALISKTGDKEINVPNLTVMFKVKTDIWIFGFGCDLKGKGRRLKHVRGIISPFVKEIPQKPYYSLLF